MGSIIELAMSLFQSIFEEGLFILIVCYVVGELVKKFNRIENRYIPVIVSIVGVVVALLCKNTVFPADTYIIVGFKGLILGWASTGGYELIRSRKSNTSTEEFVEEDFDEMYK